MKKTNALTPRVRVSKVEVTSVSSSSGVFIGNNRAVGWSSHSKSNSGFGEMSGGDSSGTLNLVIDNDVIDSPINDNDAVTMMELGTEASAGQPGIYFDHLDVNTLDTNSTIAVGDNRQLGWGAHSKTNAGNGDSFGNTVTAQNINVVQDNDIVDAPIANQSTNTNRPSVGGGPKTNEE